MSSWTDLARFPNNSAVEFTNVFDNTVDFSRVNAIALASVMISLKPPPPPPPVTVETVVYAVDGDLAPTQEWLALEAHSYLNHQSHHTMQALGTLTIPYFPSEAFRAIMVDAAPAFGGNTIEEVDAKLADPAVAAALEAAAEGHHPWRVGGARLTNSPNPPPLAMFSLTQHTQFGTNYIGDRNAFYNAPSLLTPKYTGGQLVYGILPEPAHQTTVRQELFSSDFPITTGLQAILSGQRAELLDAQFRIRATFEMSDGSTAIRHLPGVHRLVDNAESRARNCAPPGLPLSFTPNIIGPLVWDYNNAPVPFNHWHFDIVEPNSPGAAGGLLSVPDNATSWSADFLGGGNWYDSVSKPTSTWAPAAAPVKLLKRTAATFSPPPPSKRSKSMGPKATVLAPPIPTIDAVMHITCPELEVVRTTGSSGNQTLALVPFDVRLLPINPTDDITIVVDIPVNSLVWRSLKDVHISTLSIGVYNGSGDYHTQLNNPDVVVTMKVRYK